MKKSILFVIESLNVGGAEKALVSLLQNIDMERYDVTLCLISECGEFLKDARQIPGLKVKGLLKGRGFITNIKSKLLYSWLPDRVVGNYLCRGYDVAVAFCEGYLTKWVSASTVKCRKIAWVHTDMVTNDWPVATGMFPRRQAEVEAYRRFDHVVGVSKLVSEGLKSEFGCNNVATIYNILDPKLKEKAAEPIPKQPRHALNLVGVGRLEQVKGFDRLIEALHVLVGERGRDIHLTLVGDGSQRAALEKMVVGYGLRQNVTFTGKQSNPYPYIRQADVMVCPSRHEGFNIAILEAMTLGKPVVATDCAGPSEILDGGKYGLLCDNSVEGLVEAIKSIDDNWIWKMTKPSIDRAMSFAAEKQVKAIYSIL